MSNPRGFRGIRGLLVDMDGVLYRGEAPLPGLAAFFAALAEEHLEYLLVTNNSTRTAQQFADKLAGLGVTVDPGRILTSVDATAAWLAHESPAGGTAYVVGERSLRDAVYRTGRVRFRRYARAPDYVVVGLDTELSYRKLKIAALALQRGARFVAANADSSLPVEEGLVPGAGAIIAALSATTGRQPVVVGKPAAAFVQLALERLGMGASQVAMVGDRLETDIAAGQAGGLRTVLLLSGVTSPEDLNSSSVRPDHVFRNLADFTAAWRGQGRE